jgi:hypothetical protein
MDNKALWDSVKVTDPRAVKKITGKPYQGDSPKPYWLIERATEVFGPIGIGWGVTVKSERFERLTDTDVLHVAVVSVWYVHNGMRAETFDQMGGTKAAYQSKNGQVIDEDAGKKSVTDGMVKCLSMIGFAGDIFSGQWGDSKYIDWAADYHRQREEAANPVAEEPAELDGIDMDTLGEIRDYLIECHKAGKDLDAINCWYRLSTFDEQEYGTAQDARKWVWGQLGEKDGKGKPLYSKLRSAIKDNMPEEFKVKAREPANA